MLNSRRRALLGNYDGETPILPAEFQRVEYIQCDNKSGAAAYLDLPAITFPLGSRITIWVKQNAATSTDAGFLGRRDASGAFELYYNGGVALAYGSGISDLDVSYGDTYDVVSATKMNYDANEFLLMQYRPDKYFFSGRCFRAFVELNGTRTIDLIACYRKSDGEIGMYDIVSGAFFANAGTGSFTKGADV